MRRPLLRSLRLAWYGVAALVVSLAVASVALRLALPGLDARRGAIERAAGAITGIPVRIERLRADWRGAFPSVVADGVTLGGDDAPSALRFAHAEVDIALLASLSRREPVLERLALEGVELTVRREADGRFVIAGLPPRRTAFLDWLLRQRDVSVSDADLVFEDRLRDTPPQRFENLFLALRGGREPVLQAMLDGASALGTAPRLELRRGADGGTELRAALEGVAPGPLLAFAGRDTDAAAKLHSVDGRVWLRWRDGALGRVAFDLRANLAPGADTAGFGPRTLEVAGVASPGDAGWRARLARLRAGPSAGPVRDADTFVEVSGLPATPRVALHTERLALDLLDALGVATPAPPRARLRGELHGLRAVWQRAGNGQPAFYAAGQIRLGRLGRQAPLPAFERIEAGFALNASAGALAFDGGGFVVEDAERLVAPLEFSGLTGILRWQREAAGDGTDAQAGWRLATTGLEGEVAAMPFQLAGHASLAPGRRPRTELTLELGAADLARLPLLLPRGALKERAETWFRRAFRAGQLTRLQAELRGDLARFPFDAGEGVFSLDFALADTELEYSDKWPVVSGVAGRGAVAGRHFAASLDEGRFFSSPARDVRLAIADLFNPKPVLTGGGSVRATPADAIAMIEQSPLAQGPLRKLTALAVEGPLDLELALDIGLKRGERKSVSGTLRLDGNSLRTPEGVELRALRGEIAFTRERWQGEGISGEYDGAPVSLALEGRGPATAPDAGTELRMEGSADAAQIVRQLERYAPLLHGVLARSERLGALSGRTAWRATLRLPAAPADTEPPPRRLRIDSNLVDLAIDLPWPLGKTAGEARRLRIDAELGGVGERVHRLSLDDTVHVRVDRERRADGTYRALRTDIAFGTEAEARKDGIHLHGDLAELPLAEWTSLLARGLPPAQGAPQPVSFDARVRRFRIIGQTFEDVRIEGRRDDAWRATLASARLAGTVTAPLRLDSAPLTLNLERLWLEKVESKDKPELVDPRRIPTVALACASFRYGTIDFGSASMATERVTDGQRLKSLVFTNPAFQASATGDWWLRERVHESHFNISLKGRTLRDVLTAFAFDAKNIDGGPTELRVKADWPGMPSEFTLARLDGSLGLEIGKGRFLDIEPGGGRIFGLLSLQTLPRRLSLDFSDLFSKGFAFDRIEGVFELDNGDAYTNNLFMEGPSAKVEISGRTGLAAKDYDQRAVVTPALSDSIPIASALFGPAGIGVGAAIYLGQKVFKQVPEQVDRFLRREYTIKGPWSDPVIEKR